MTDDSNVLRVRPTHNDGYRTPAIEDDDHPLNLWRTHRSSHHHGDSYFPPQNPAVQEQFDRFRRLDNSSSNECGQSPTSDPALRNHLPWRERVKHTTWAYFTMTMATGGIANALHSVPFRSDWLYYVGLFFFFLNLVLYVLIWSMLLTRFLSYPTTFRSSLVHPTESLFVPAFVVSLGTICITIVEYGANNTGQWLTRTVLILFWINVVLAVVLSITIYMVLWSSLTFTIAQMTPIWIFPAYPLLIVGPHAANLSSKLADTTSAIEVIVGGFTVQGIGFLVSLTIYSAFIYRLMTQKLPADPLRPGMFVSVGPAAFTCSGTIGMAQNLPSVIAADYSPGQTFMEVDALLAANILRLVGNWMSLWLWGLAIWFFFVSVISNIAPLYTRERKSKGYRKQEAQRGEARGAHVHKIPFAMTWYSYIFPQTALTTATFRVAEAFNVRALKIVGCVMVAMLVAMWLFVVCMMIKAIVQKQILWPEKGEDREEGGFVKPARDFRKVSTRSDAEAQKTSRLPNSTW